jgi:hypothetical protein
VGDIEGSIFGDNCGGWRQPVELIVQASPNDISGCLFTDVDPNNPKNVLIEGRGRPQIDVEILRLHSKIVGDGIFEASPTVQPTRPLFCDAKIVPPPPPAPTPTLAEEFAWP